MSLKSLDRNRAEFVFNKITDAKKKWDPQLLKSYAKSVPAYIKQNGLVAAYAFIEPKGKEYKVLVNITREWLDQQDAFTVPQGSLAGYFAAMEPADYKAAENEIMALYKWIRRFVEGDKNESDGKD